MDHSSKSQGNKCAKRCSQCEIKHEFICPVIIVFEAVLLACVLVIAVLSVA